MRASRRLWPLRLLLRRRSHWRAVSFGIWWFLIALLPDALVPHQAVEADWRTFLPFAGLALAAAGAASIALEALTRTGSAESRRLIPLSIAGVLAAGLLALFGWAAFERSAVWQSEATLWSNTIKTSPRNGRALMRYGLIRLAAIDPADGYNYMRRAETLTPRDPIIEINLATAYERLSQSADAESQFQRALADGPSWLPRLLRLRAVAGEQNTASRGLPDGIESRGDGSLGCCRASHRDGRHGAGHEWGPMKTIRQ